MLKEEMLGSFKNGALCRGQVVKVRKDLEVGKYYNDVEFVKDMEELKEANVTIEEFALTTASCNDIRYLIKEDKGYNYWTDDMFETISRKESNFKHGDKVIVRNNLEVGKVYGDVEFTEKMEIYKGEEVEIELDCNNGHYCIKCEHSSDCFNHVWSEEMFEPVEEEKSETMITKYLAVNKEGKIVDISSMFVRSKLEKLEEGYIFVDFFNKPVFKVFSIREVVLQEINIQLKILYLKEIGGDK